MESETVGVLLGIPLFHGADEKLLTSVLSDLSGSDFQSEKTFSAGEQILSGESREKNLSVILEGKAQVLSPDKDRRVLLRTLEKGDVFGVAELFGEGDAGISRIEAVKKCRVLFIPESKMGILLERDKKLMYNYLSFLSCRIRFLGKRIACFTAGSAERRLAFYLDSLACEGKNEDVSVTPEMSMGALALMLDIGRASLYRAVDTLSIDGFITKNGKDFIIKDREKMLKYYSK